MLLSGTEAFGCADIEDAKEKADCEKVAGKRKRSVRSAGEEEEDDDDDQEQEQSE